MRSLLVVGCLVLTVGLCSAQSQAASAAPSAQLSGGDTNRLCARIVQLMEAGGVALPDLQRAAVPIVANIRQACQQVEVHPGAGQATFSLLNNVRAYLDLSDAIPKPYPFPEVARDQFREVRDAWTRLDAHFRALLETKDTDLVSPDPDNLSRFREDNRLLPAAKTNGRRVVFLGDSTLGEWRLNQYFPAEDFINRGIGGQRTGQLLARMKSDVIDLHPEAVVIGGGAIDLTRNIPLTAIEDNYLLIAELAAANNIKIIFTSVLPVNDYLKAQNPAFERTPSHPATFIRALNDWMRALCNRPGYTFVDFTPVVSDASGVLMEDASDDGLLPNSKGYRLMAPLIAQGVERATGSTLKMDHVPMTPIPQAPKPASPVKPSRGKSTSK
ncbi:MAG: GDSL-type esterase/lipase family protein [Acidobacteriota bacterium]